MTTSSSPYRPRVAAEAINRCFRCQTGTHEVCLYEQRYCECSCVPVQRARMAAEAEAAKRLAKAKPKKRWCVRHLTGWCLVKDDIEPDEGSWNVPTECDQFVVVPFGYDKRLPTCVECADVLVPEQAPVPA